MVLKQQQISKTFQCLYTTRIKLTIFMILEILRIPNSHWTRPLVFSSIPNAQWSRFTKEMDSFLSQRDAHLVNRCFI